jgi:hypothetical protein
MSELLTAKELEDLEAEVQKEIDKEAKAKAKEEAKKLIKARIRQQVGLDEPMVEVTIETPPYYNPITLDGYPYELGRTYRVRKSVADVLHEQMFRGWREQAKLEGREQDYYLKMRQTMMSGRTGAVINAPQGRGNYLKV